MQLLSSMHRASLAALAAGLAMTAGAALAVPPHAGPASRAPLVLAIVTDVDPASPAANGAVHAARTPSFDAWATDHLYVVGLYDRALVGDQPFDQHMRLILPNGDLYVDHVRPVVPNAAPDEMVQRPDLAVHPVRVANLTPAPAAAARGLVLRDAVVAFDILPVSGSWPTRHGLYGTWTAEIVMERDGKVIATASTTFELRGNGR